MSTIFGINRRKCYSLTVLKVGSKKCSTDSVSVKNNEHNSNFNHDKLSHSKSELVFCGDNKYKVQNSTAATSGFKTSQVSLAGNDKFRTNPLNIQMISESLHRQIFGQTDYSNPPNLELIEKAKSKLKEHGLWKDKVDFIDNVSFNIPKLKGTNIEEHFRIISEDQSKPYREIVNLFIKNKIPQPPNKWLCQKGWTKYVKGMEPVSIPFPDDEILVFDVEVNVKIGELPTLATAVSANAWYGWVCPDLSEGVDSIPINWYTTNMLIPFEGKSVHKESPRIIIGHNVSYDRARIKEQYYIKNSALRFLDTMSLHICIGGITKSQKSSLKDKSLEAESDISKEICLCSLKELYKAYCNKDLEKGQRNIFLEGTMLDVRSEFQNLMNYCAQDVTATFEVFQAIFPVFLERCSHPATLAGMLEMGTAFLPVNSNWNKFLSEADQTYEDLNTELSSILSKKCDNACKLFHEQQYKKDLWMWSEDWTTQELKLTKKKIKPKTINVNNSEEKNNTDLEEDEIEKALKLKYQYLYDLEELLPKKRPFLPGYPLWYRKLVEKPGPQSWNFRPQLSTSMLVTPKLLNLTWENFPLYHTREFGWGILVPDILASNSETLIPFENLKELTLKICNIDHLKELEENLLRTKRKKHNSVESLVPYYKGSAIWCDHIVDECCYFFKIPHKNGAAYNVGNPLSKDLAHVFYKGVLNSDDAEAMKVMDLSHKLTYWRNSKQRISSQMVVWLNKKEACTVNSDEDVSTGVILPKVVVCGTLTRRAMEATWLTASKTIQNRIGSEIRAMIQAPPGYHFVGADVDSQELWIASLIGDSYFAKEHGSTPLGWMTLSGTKSSGTDMHSVTAKAIDISRDHAKVINYARIYGAGVKLAQKILKQSNPSLSDSEALEKATKMYDFTKGKKVFRVKESIKKALGCGNVEFYDLTSAIKFAEGLGEKMGDVFEKPQWINGTESAMFNQLEKIAKSSKPVTPFLQCRLSRALEPRFEGDDLHLNTRINWVVQSGAVDFLHLMLVCMKWLTNGKARYCFSFHDEVRYLIPSEERYNAALALHITNLLVRSFCAYRLGIHDLPQSVAFFASVEVDKTLRKEANDDCITPSNPHGIEKGYSIPPGESLNIYSAIQKSEGSLSPFRTGKKREMSQATKRKIVHREILQGELVPPRDNQQIVKVLSNRGSNLHEVETPQSTTFLVSMPSKFRKNVWIKRGDYVLVEDIEEGEKVKAEIVNILTPDYIKYLKKENMWPSEFQQNTEVDKTNDFDNVIQNSNRRTISSSENDSDDESE